MGRVAWAWVWGSLGGMGARLVGGRGGRLVETVAVGSVYSPSGSAPLTLFLRGPGFQKTVWLVSHNGTRYVLKTSSREGGKERKHNSNLDPRSSRQGQIRREYRMARTLVVQYGFLPYTGYCSGKTSQDETWSLWPYLARGTFPILGSNVTHEGQVCLGAGPLNIFTSGTGGGGAWSPPKFSEGGLRKGALRATSLFPQCKYLKILAPTCLWGGDRGAGRDVLEPLFMQ